MFRLILIAILVSCNTGKRTVKNDKDEQLPIWVNYQRNIVIPPDSVTKFISIALESKHYSLIDSFTAYQLMKSEMNTVIAANNKKGQSSPQPLELASKARTVGYQFNIGIYTSSKSDMYRIDSISWRISKLPYKFYGEGIVGRGSFFPNTQIDYNLYDVLIEFLKQSIQSTIKKD
ncbi:MAG TPA: hypothetical protein PLU37_13905 [Chitinophagaceae bacterium]|nr:hypothetical protein [Chitinophagaceae bacterium]HPG12621.1 hypothetical protein [Chitinophagaceae bacterium]